LYIAYHMEETSHPLMSCSEDGGGIWFKPEGLIELMINHLRVCSALGFLDPSKVEQCLDCKGILPSSWLCHPQGLHCACSSSLGLGF
jgi:hypothetical protein